MQSIDYHEIVIGKKLHTLISGDSTADKIVKIGHTGPFEENVTEDYRDLFIKYVDKCDGNWFPSELSYEDRSAFFYIRATKGKKEDTIHLDILGIDSLLSSNTELGHMLTAAKAQLDLYEDVYFGYDPVNEMVNIFNADQALFDAGCYSLKEFEELLTKNASDKQKNAVKGFIKQIKSKTGRFSARVEGNLINDDSNSNLTKLEGAFVYFDKDKEGVVGHIHLGSTKGKFVAASIKHDSLTGLVDKSDIVRIAMERIDERQLAGTTLAVVDIDFFKNINDTYGHQYGDTVIKKVADIISTVVGSDGIVGRFGGDEFLIVFYNIAREEDLRGYIRNMNSMIKEAFPDKGIDDKSPLSISVGAAAYPKDANTYDDVFMVADHCLYIAKEKGRNRYIIYDCLKHGEVEAIRMMMNSTKKLNERDVSLGDAIVKMFDQVLHGEGTVPERLMDEFALAFELQRVTLFVGTPFRFSYSAGTEAIKDPADAQFLLGFLNSEFKGKYVGDQKFIVVNRLDSLPVQAGAIKIFLKEAGVLSYVLIRFFDKDGRECILMISSIGKQTQWNQMHYKYYRAFGDLLSLFALNKF